MARQISKRMIEDVRFRSDIVEVIGSYFTLKRAGGTFKALCPFHKEKTPSFNINPQRQIFHCFGCGAGGDVFRFVMMQEGLDFVGALKMLAHKAGITLELDDDDDAGSRSDKEALYRLHAELAEAYHTLLREDPAALAARQYLEERALDEAWVDTFKIGYAPAGWNYTVQWAAERKFPVELLELAGLVVSKPGDTREPYDRFRNRLMFPITDEQGRVIGFSGRTLEADPKAAKYVNSPESPLFHKGRVLYGLARARKAIVEARGAVLCEGQIDVIRCHQCGFGTAVAAQGTAFTEDHVRIIRRYADQVTIVFDADTAGQEAAIRTAGLFIAAEMAVCVAMLPSKEDPDSFLRKRGAEAFRKLLNEARTAVGYQAEYLAQQERMNTEVGQMRVARALLQTVALSPNGVQREAMIQELGQRLGLRPSILADELKKVLYRLRRNSDAEESAPVQPMPSGNTPAPRVEMDLCEHLIHLPDHPELGDLVWTYLLLFMVTDSCCRTLMQAILEIQGTGEDLQDRLRRMDEGSGVLQQFAAAVQMAPSKIASGEVSRAQAVKDLILYLWRRRIEDERSRLDLQKVSGDEAAAMLARRQQMTHDLQSLKRWETAVPIMEIELSSVAHSG